MPPKTFKKTPVHSAQPINQPKPQENFSSSNQDQLFINPKNLQANSKTLERIRILVSLLSGIIAGLFNISQLLGPVLYVMMHLLITGLIVVKVGSADRFFMKSWDITGGIGSGVLIFVCAWMIVYNVVYTL